MKSVCTFFAFALIVSAAQVASAATPDKPEVQAQLLDHNEYLCDNCLFGSSSYYYCFEADNKILIGYQKVPVDQLERSGSQPSDKGSQVVAAVDVRRTKNSAPLRRQKHLVDPVRRQAGQAETGLHHRYLHQQPAVPRGRQKEVGPRQPDLSCCAHCCAGS